MIQMYIDKRCSSSNKAIVWMQKHQIDVKLYSIRSISKEELIQVLAESEQGFESITKKPNKGSFKDNKKRILMRKLSFNSALCFLKYNPDLLRTPLILEGQKTMIGFNSEEIRKFIPRSTRTYCRMN